MVRMFFSVAPIWVVVLLTPPTSKVAPVLTVTVLFWPRAEELATVPIVERRVPALTVTLPANVLSAESVASPAPFLIRPPTPEITPVAVRLPVPSNVRSYPALVIAPLTVRVPAVLTNDWAAFRVEATPQVLLPAWLSRPHWSVTAVPDRENPPLAKTTWPTAVNRLLAALCLIVPWNVSTSPLVGRVPFQLAAVLQLLSVPAPFHWLEPAVTREMVPVVAKAEESHISPTGGLGRETVANDPA